MDEPKRVLINDLMLYRQRSGIAYYVRELLRRLPAVAPEIELVRMSRTLAGAPIRLAAHAHQWLRRGGAASAKPGLGGKSLTNVKRIAQRALAAYTQLAGKWSHWPVYHETDAFPLGFSGATVTTIHDLSVLLFPDWHPEHRVQRYADEFRQACQRTKVFVTDAEITKTELVTRLSIDPDRIRVIPLAPRPMFQPAPRATIQSTRRRLGLPDRYLLYVGTIEPRKNVLGMLHAYGELTPAQRAQTPLVLVGGWGWKSEAVQSLLDQSPWRESVRWLGYLSNADLVTVLSGALALVYPSFYEGFGLPPVEAMACGTPVITTHAGSLKEVIQDAALIVDPSSNDSLVDAIRLVVNDPSIREEYTIRGKRHVQRFSWDETARQTADVYLQAA